MLAKELMARFLTTARSRVYGNVWKRYASTTTLTTSINNTIPLFDRALLHNSKNITSVANVSEHVSRLRPFSVPAPPQPSINQPTSSSKVVEELELTSVLRKRRLKMNKHKHKKLRKRTRALRKKLGK